LKIRGEYPPEDILATAGGERPALGYPECPRPVRTSFRAQERNSEVKYSAATYPVT